MFKRVSVFFALAFVPAVSTAEPLEGDYLYRVSTVRAAPGQFAELLEWLDTLHKSTYYSDSGTSRPLVMRHAQGDQWDLMIITPMQSFAAFYSGSATEQRSKAAEKYTRLLNRAEAMIAFEEDIFAYGPPLQVVSSAYSDNAFYHIEMFNAAPGLAEKLVEQRRMENEYLTATGQIANMIFRRAAGSDIDVFTIGFHRSLESFAAPASASDNDKEAAAKAAGFEDRADISFYLRALISGHHDTLAGKVN